MLGYHQRHRMAIQEVYYRSKQGSRILVLEVWCQQVQYREMLHKKRVVFQIALL